MPQAYLFFGVQHDELAQSEILIFVIGKPEE